jgi:hypothetical protein
VQPELVDEMNDFVGVFSSWQRGQHGTGKAARISFAPPCHAWR